MLFRVVLSVLLLAAAAPAAAIMRDGGLAAQLLTTNTDNQYAPEAPAPSEEPRSLVPHVGDICNMDQDLTVAEMENQYYQCVAPSTQDWHWPQLGIWSLQNCTDNKIFSPHNGGCRNESSVRRQQAAMCQNPFGGCGQQMVIHPSNPHDWNPPLGGQQPWHPHGGYGGNPCVGVHCGHVHPVAPVVHPVAPVVHPAPYVHPVQPVIHPHVHPVNPCPQPPCYPQPVQPVNPCPQPPCHPQPVQPMPVPVQPIVPVHPVIPHPIVQPVPHNPCAPPNHCPRPVVKRPCPMRSGGLCSWMLAPLRPGPNKGFLQCVPAPFVHEYCGRWIPRPCAYGTVFNAQIQVCVHDPHGVPRPVAQNICPPQNIPIGHCGTNHHCPGQSTCQAPTNMCCQPGRFG